MPLWWLCCLALLHSFPSSFFLPFAFYAFVCVSVSVCLRRNGFAVIWVAATPSCVCVYATTSVCHSCSAPSCALRAAQPTLCVRLWLRMTCPHRQAPRESSAACAYWRLVAMTQSYRGLIHDLSCRVCHGTIAPRDCLLCLCIQAPPVAFASSGSLNALFR